MFRWLTGFILLPPPQAQMQADEKFVAEQLPAIVAGLLRVTGVQEDEPGAASSSAAAPAPADDGGLAFDMFAAQQRPQGPRGWAIAGGGGGGSTGIDRLLDGQEKKTKWAMVALGAHGPTRGESSEESQHASCCMC